MSSIMRRAHRLVGHGDAPVLSEGCEPLISRQAILPIRDIVRLSEGVCFRKKSIRAADFAARPSL
jgi:hypothetical protein